MDTQIHFCFLQGPKKPSEYQKGVEVRPVLTESIKALGITREQALAVCEELNNHTTIAAWLTGAWEVKKDVEESIQD